MSHNTLSASPDFSQSTDRQSIDMMRRGKDS